MKKKVILAGALIALMAVGAFAQAYNAESDFQVTKTATAVTITRYVGRQNVSEVNIPPTIQNLPVTTIAGNAFTANIDINSVTIPGSVTTIQSMAFYSLVNLRRVTFLGPIPRSGMSSDPAFNGDLVAKFYATDRNNGTPGTYTRSNQTWTLTPAANVAPASTQAYNAESDFRWSRTSDGRGIVITDYIGTATAVRIPDRISNLPVVRIGDNAFSAMKAAGRPTFDRYYSITSIVIPNTVTEIGNGAFHSLNNLNSINLPTSLITIGENAFNSCFLLTSFSLPASIRTIGSGAFHDCQGLTTITIPASVTRITFGTADERNIFYRSKLDSASQTRLRNVGYTGSF